MRILNKSKRIFIILICMILVIELCSCRNKSACSSENDTIKLSTYNIRTNISEDSVVKTWDYRKEYVVEQLKSEKPDILCVQEAKESQFNYLVKMLPHYNNLYYNRKQTQNDSEGLAIFYNNKFKLLENNRFWLSETENTSSFGWNSKYERFAILAIFAYKNTKQKFCIVNTHLEFNNLIAQKNSIELINKKIPSDISSIIMGDFNFKENSNEYKYALNYFIDCKALAKYVEDSFTYNCFGNESKFQKIDYIFTKNSQFEVLKYQVHNEKYGEIYASDHFPVSITIRLNNEKFNK